MGYIPKTSMFWRLGKSWTYYLLESGALTTLETWFTVGCGFMLLADLALENSAILTEEVFDAEYIIISYLWECCMKNRQMLAFLTARTLFKFIFTNRQYYVLTLSSWWKL